MRNKKAFTLIELLAVIVILGLLMILTFPKILEMVNNQKANISDAKLNLMYTATKSYLFDHSNQYPERMGNTYCIKPKTLEEGNYITFETNGEYSDYVVKVSYFEDNEYQLSYVKAATCTDNGVINSELAGLTCNIDKSGYSISKKVTISFPKSDEFIYQYSLDEGKSWKQVKNFDSDNKLFFNFQSSGSVLAKVLIQNSTSSLSCSAYVDMIDPTPVGTVLAFAGNEVPDGYLLADGSSVIKSRYYDLFDIITNTYGTPSNSKSFLLPDLTGKLPVGMDASDPDLALGSYGGKKSQSLSVNELPAHTHTFTGTSNQQTSMSGGNHTHNVGQTDTAGSHGHSGMWWNSINDSNSISLNSGENGYRLSWTAAWDTGGGGDSEFLTGDAGAHTHTFTGTTGGENTNHTHSITAEGSNDDVGGDGAHNNLMPYSTLKYIIKYQ